ncbi:MAG: hypothetical protein EOO16_10820 [Chitinophagaceae bacterium]|nr:MAG: hypothetical protein EOO16_10820 [Chitinophagaceae bacterium]
MNALSLQSEQEAAVAILFACLFQQDAQPGEARIEQLSRMLVLCSRFRGHDLTELSSKALQAYTRDGARAVVEGAAPLITPDFKETLFAMICELMTDAGQLPESSSEQLGACALYLGIPVELMRSMLTTYLIRNRFNVQIIE